MWGRMMMKRLIAVAAILAAGLATASAADLRMPVKAPPVVEPPFTWAGFYLGGNIGYGWGRGRTDLSETQTQTAVLTNLIGGIGGAAGPGNGTTATTSAVAFGSGSANID